MSSSDSRVRGSNTLSKALIHAIESGNADFCERLLNSGADANSHDNHWSCCTALLSALRSKQPKLAEMLIRRGASNSTQMCDIPIIGERITPRGYSAMHFAAALGYERVLEMLLERRHQSYDTDSVTPLHLAARNGHLSCVKLLIKYFEKTMATESGDPSDCRGQKILNSIIRCTGPVQSWRLTRTLRYPGTFGGTSLHQAVAGCHEALVVYLIEAGTKVDLRDEKGLTALHVSAYRGCDEITRILIKSGADVDCRAFGSCTSLHLAVHNGHVGVVLELSRYGVDFTLVDCFGSNAMDIALRTANVDMVSCLIGFGQKISKLESQASSPLYSSLSSGFSNLSLLLLDFSKGFTSEYSPCGSLLIKANTNCHPSIVRRLLRKLKERRQEFPTLEPTSYLSSALCYFSGLGIIDLMNQTLDAGADINGFSKTQDTPLGTACAMGHLDAVKSLVRRGANTSWKDQHAQDVSALEKAKGHQHVVDWLRDSESSVLDVPKIITDRGASSIGGDLARAYSQAHECKPTIFDLRPPSCFGICRRNSFVQEYALRKFNFMHILPSNSNNQTQRKMEWDRLEFRKQYFRTYCYAICKERDILLPLRYSSYPLSTRILRLRFESPWEVF